MKKTKIWLVIAGVLCAVGVITCFGAWAALDMDFMRLDLSSALEEQVYSAAAGEVGEIRVDAGSCGVQLIPSADENIRLRYFTGEEWTGEIVHAEGSIQLNYQERWNAQKMFQMFRGLKNFRNVITVEIPVSFTGGVAVENNSGKISAEGLQTGGALTLHTQNAGIELNHVICTKANIQSNNGTIKLEAVQSAEELEVAGENGKILLDSVTARQMKLENDSGKISIKNSKAELAMQADNENAGIYLEKSTAKDFVLENENGTIQGTILGAERDYQISCTTENGRCNLENRLDREAAGTLQVKNENGSIQLQFVQE